MRLMLDTCAIIDLLTDMETLGKGAMALIDDPENVLFAITERMPLLSSDDKFPFYRNQGLELIEY